MLWNKIPTYFQLFVHVLTKMYIFLYIIALIVDIGSASDIIDLPQGKVEGFEKTSFYGRKFLAFEGIPYAKPPVGKLRFAEPQPAENWNGVLKANISYTCLQYLPIPGIGFTLGTEDCLYLYVYVPREKINSNENLHVIAYFHGGGFMFGDPSHMGGPDYLMDKDIIFVSFNYRLSVLGFLSTEDNVVSGNNGLKDQVLALKWIQKNIKYFGGNPQSITIYGLSAGAVSVHHHYLSPLSKGLFHRGFSQSGSALLPWALVKNPLIKAQRLANYLSCPTNSNKKMIKCLKRFRAKDLATAAVKALTVFMDNIPFALFGPVVEKGDNPFLPDLPYKLMKQGRMMDVPWISSNVKDEGIFPTNLIMGLHLWDQFDNWTYLMPYALDLQQTVEKNDLEDVALKIRHFYFDDKPLSDENVYSMVKLFSDRLYIIDSEKSVRTHAQAVKAPIYYYLFKYEPIETLQIPGMPHLKGVAHGGDSIFLTKMSFMGLDLQVKGADEDMMRLFTDFLMSYAETGKPKFGNVDWIPLSTKSTELNVLEINSATDYKMKRMTHIGPVDFWNSLPIHENDKIM